MDKENCFQATFSLKSAMKVFTGKAYDTAQTAKISDTEEALVRTKKGISNRNASEVCERKLSAGEEMTQAILRSRRNVESKVRKRYHTMPVFSTVEETPKSQRAVSFCPEVLLLFAVMENNKEELEKILREGNANVNQANSIGRLPIHEAASEGFVECAEILIENGANLNLKCSEGLTPLEIAVISGHYECAELFIKSGAPIDKIKNGFIDPIIVKGDASAMN